MTSGPSRCAWKNATASSTRGANRSAVEPIVKLGDDPSTAPVISIR